MDPPAESAMETRAIKTWTERARRRMRGLYITRWRFNVALCLTVLLDMDAASAAAWTLRRRKWLSQPLQPQPDPEALLQRALEDAVLAASVEFSTDWTDPNVAALGRSALRAATKASRDRRVRDWVAGRNATDGASVSSTAVVNRWNAQSQEMAGVGADLQTILDGRAAVSQRVC